MKKILLLIITLCFASQTQAEEIVNTEVQKSLAETQASMQKSIEEMDKQMQQIMPAMAQSMSQMMQDVFKTLPPLMKSLEENKVLSKAAEQMNREINTQVKQLDSELKQYESYKQEKNTASEDKFAVSGSKNDNGKTLDFSFSQNDKAFENLRKAIDYKTSPQKENEKLFLTDLKNQNRDIADFKFENIGGNRYLVSESGNETYITGIMDNGIIVRVQTGGENASERARNFIANSKQKIFY